MVIIDFETRSHCDIKTAGAYLYATHPTTEIICMSYAWADGNEVYTWQPGEKLPSRFFTETCIAAHNAEFDWLIWNHCSGLPELPLEAMYCTEALCRVNGVPAGLEKAARFTEIPHRKNPKGAALIKAMCVPPYDNSRLAEMIEYCEQDVRTTRALLHVLRPMTEQELEDWRCNVRLNGRGVTVDRYMARRAVASAELTAGAIAKQLDDLTEGVVTKPTQHKRIKDWLGDRGIYVRSTDAASRAELLARSDLPADAHEFITLVDAAGKSSVAKYQQMLNRSDENGLLRGAFIYYGASQTGRFSAHGLQLHNFPRNALSPADAEALIDSMDAGDEVSMATLSQALRSAIVPPSDDHSLIVGDWSAIEACALPWLANDSRADHKLDALRRGEDIYKSEFTGWDGDDRQVHKVIELSLGYGGAAGAFEAMAKNYGVSLPAHTIDGIVTDWRLNNSWAVDFWNDCAAAAETAIRHPGEYVPAGRLEYVYALAGVGRGTLMCLLPDGSALSYPDAHLSAGELSARKAALSPKQNESQWPRVSLWRGLLVENATQAVCAALLREKLRELPTAIAHVHDEIILVASNEDAETVRYELKQTMETCPNWAKGLPLRADPQIMTRYGK